MHVFRLWEEKGAPRENPRRKKGSDQVWPSFELRSSMLWGNSTIHQANSLFVLEKTDLKKKQVDFARLFKQSLQLLFATIWVKIYEKRRNTS